MADFLDEKDFARMATMISIKLNKGDVAPKYEPKDVGQVGIEKAIITEKGMLSGCPLVDLQLIDKNGNKFFLAVTGRIIQSLSSVIDGVNQRNHGVKNP